MKLLLACCVLVTFHSHGQSAINLVNTAKTLDELIPNNWILLDSTSGDLNQDGIQDIVFAIQKNDPNNIEINDGLGIDSIDLNPRVMAIYFGTASDEYQKTMVADSFIILRDSPTMDEPFEGFSINKKGVLDINFHFWYSAGSWYMSNHTYRFRYQNNEFALIGYDSYEAHRASGETTEHSINFLTKKMKISKGNFSNDEPESLQWKKFQLNNIMTLQSIGKPFNSEFEGIYF